MVCGKGEAGAGYQRLCHMVVALPSSTLLAWPFTRVVSSSLAEAVQPVRDKGSGAASVAAAGSAAL
jgi:hypothetical protein